MYEFSLEECDAIESCFLAALSTGSVVDDGDFPRTDFPEVEEQVVTPGTADDLGSCSSSSCATGPPVRSMRDRWRRRKYAVAVCALLQKLHDGTITASA